MKTLLLLRHAKSSWKNTSLPDFERPLNARGRRAADQIGGYLKKKNLRPDLVLSSTATRARETIGIVLESSRFLTDLRYDERLYLASAERLLNIISQLEIEWNQVLLVGHNPGMEELLFRLSGVDHHMPTAALAKIVLDDDTWTKVVETKGARLEFLVKPKELSTETRRSTGHH